MPLSAALRAGPGQHRRRPMRQASAEAAQSRVRHPVPSTSARPSRATPAAAWLLRRGAPAWTRSSGRPAPGRHRLLWPPPEGWCRPIRVATGVKSTGMNMYASGKKMVRVPIEVVESSFPYTLVTAQTETERVLTAHLAAQGAIVERGLELTELSQDDDAVPLVGRHSDGKTEEIEASWVIGTDGGHTTVRHLMGTQLQGSFKGERFILGDVEVEPHFDKHQHVHLLRPRRSGSHATDAWWPGAVPGADSRCAGHATDPAPHSGAAATNHRCLDAFNLCWKLAAVIKGDAGNALWTATTPSVIPSASRSSTSPAH